jgi:hypothetical protein
MYPAKLQLGCSCYHGLSPGTDKGMRSDWLACRVPAEDALNVLSVVR